MSALSGRRTALPSIPSVPAARFAVLLAERRRALELDHATLARRSNGSFTAGFLAEVERGRTFLDERTLLALAELYELNAGPVVPSRTPLELDLVAGTVALGATQLSLPGPTADHVLEHYVSLLSLLRGVDPGQISSLRDDDLTVLAAGLGRSPSQVRSHLEHVIAAAAPDVDERRRNPLALLGVGACVVVGAASGLWLVLGAGGDPDPVEVVAIEQTRPLDVPAPHAASPNLSDPLDVLDAPSEVGEPQASTQPPSGSGPAIEPVPGPSPHQVTSDDGRGQRGSDAPSVTVLGPSVPDIANDEVDLSSTSIDAAADDAVGARWLDMIEGDLDIDIASLARGWDVSFVEGRDSHHGLTSVGDRQIVVYVDENDSLGHITHVLLHEIGHAIDIDRLSPEARGAWLVDRGIDEWWAGDGRTDFSHGAGDFAEAVAYVLGDTTPRSTFGPWTDEQLAFVAQLIAVDPGAVDAADDVRPRRASQLD